MRGSGRAAAAGWQATAPLTVRLAEPRDLAPAARLIEAGFVRSIAPGYDVVGRVAFRMYAAERALADRLAGGALVLVAERLGTVLGYAEVQGRERVLTGRDHLSLLFVAPHLQRRGIGRLLLDEIRRRLRALPDPPADLTVHSAPNAVGAYARFGFVATGPESQAGGVVHVPMRLGLRRSAGEAAQQRAGEPAEADQRTHHDGERRHVADA